MLRKTTLILMLLVGSPMVHAFTEGRLLSKSTTGMTVQFNLGTHDNIKAGDFGVIAKQIADTDSRTLRVISVAQARIVKSSSDSSVWIIYQPNQIQHLIRGDKFILLTESNMLKGRVDPEMGSTTVVLNQETAKQEAVQAAQKDKNRLSKLKNQYRPLEITKQVEDDAWPTVEQVDFDTWNYTKDSKKDYLTRTAVFRGLNKKQMSRRRRLGTFENMVSSYFKRVNDPDFNYENFYAASLRSEVMNELKVKTDIDSEYNKFLNRESKRATADAKLMRTILEKGESWSEDYSDEELRLVLNEVSVLHEVDRRDWVGANPNRYMVAFDIGMIMTDAQTDADPGYRRDANRSYELDFEAIPLLGHKSLERFTLNTSFRNSKNAFEADGYNADVNELSLTLGANWYPYRAPYAIESAVWLFGVYVRTGFAYVQAPTLNEKGNYTVMSIPGMRAGFKYLMRNNWGMRLIFSMETLKLEQYEASKLNSTLPSQTNLVEAKLGIGVSYGF